MTPSWPTRRKRRLRVAFGYTFLPGARRSPHPAFRPAGWGAIVWTGLVIGYFVAMTAASGDAAKAISILDYHINAAVPGSAEQTALQQARYRIMTEAGLNGVDDVEPFDPEGKAPTKAQNAAVAKQLQVWADEAENAGQAAPFVQAVGVLEGGEDDA